MSDPATPWTVARQAPLSMNSSGKNTGVGCHSLLHGIFPTQESNPGLMRCRWILYCLSYWESYPRPPTHTPTYPHTHTHTHTLFHYGLPPPTYTHTHTVFSIMVYPHPHTHPHTHTHSHTHTLFHYGLSQDVAYSSLYYTVGPCLSILYM